MSKISKERKITYYIGKGLMVLGVILFLSFFVFFGVSMNDPFGNPPPFLNAVFGMILMIIGSVVAGIGEKGLAGSGLKLDPEEAREDLKPFNEAKGKMINDVISNIEVIDNISKSQQTKEIIKIRCKTCNSLNDEDAKFCKNCGERI